MQDTKTEESLKGRRITGNARTEIASGIRDRYHGGESIRQIAESMGRSDGFVHRVLNEAGADLRSRGRSGQKIAT